MKALQTFPGLLAFALLGTLPALILLGQAAPAQGTRTPDTSTQSTSTQSAAARSTPPRSTTTQQAAGRDTAAIERGRAVYDYWCATCHAAGPGYPGTASLALKYGANRPAVLTEREDLTPEAIKVFVRRGVLSMAPFRKTEITDAELDDLAAFLSRTPRRP